MRRFSQRNIDFRSVRETGIPACFSPQRDNWLKARAGHNAYAPPKPSSGLLLQHQPIGREPRYFARVGQVEFFFDMGAVRFDGF